MDVQDFSDIQSCIHKYFDCLYTGNTDVLMGEVFHENAHLYAADMGSGFVDWDMPAFKAVIDGRPSPESRGCERRERIVSIDEAGPDTAMVKVEVLVGTRDFVDYLTVIKLAGAWRIISKTCVLIADEAVAEAAAE